MARTGILEIKATGTKEDMLVTASQMLSIMTYLGEIRFNIEGYWWFSVYPHGRAILWNSLHKRRFEYRAPLEELYVPLSWVQTRQLGPNDLS